MRLLLRTLCVVALVGCSDSAVPTEHPAPEIHGRLAAGTSNDASPKPALTPTTTDLASVMTRLEWLIGPRVAQVSIPPDEYSLSPDAVHPDIACPAETWNARRCWLMYTPYHNGDSHYENPGLLYAADDSTWNTPPAVHNPLIPYPGPSKYNSDPDHAFDRATRRLVQVYRVVADSSNYIMLMSTADAMHWTRPTLVFRAPSHDAVSPSLVLEPDRTARLWYVQSGVDGCNTLSATVAMRTAAPAADSSYEHAVWSRPVPVAMSIPKYVIWHIDMMPLAGSRGYLALITAFPRGTSCANSDLWIASSTDGVAWTTYAVPVFWRTMQAARARSIDTWYRGTMLEDSVAGRLHLWPSALAKGQWTVYHTSVKLGPLLDLLRSARASDFQAALLAKTNRMRPIDMP